MLVCGICRETKDTKNKWTIHEHAVDNTLLREFKICENCASELITKVLKEMNPEKIQGNQVVLSGTSILDSVILYPDKSLEIILSMDLAKARKLVLESAEKAEKKAEVLKDEMKKEPVDQKK